MTDYIELHNHSNFSLLDGASHPEELVEQAARLDMPTLALTDHDAVYGVVRFVQAARKAGIRPILGAELTFEGGAHLTLLVENETGWSNLCWLISRARHNAPKGEAALPHADLPGHTAGLIALSGCRRGSIPAALLADDLETARDVAQYYRELFGPDRFWIELQHHLLPDDDDLVAGLAVLAQRVGVGYVATNNVHYATRDRRALQDVLVCIKHGVTLGDTQHQRRPTSEYYLKDARRVAPLLAAYPEAIANTRRIAERCTFDLRYGLQDLPTFPTPPGMETAVYLRRLCLDALPRRYAAVPAVVETRLDHELAVITRAGLANYFLMVWDIVRYAREHNIRCQGRGSAANSLVAYLLDITPVDPLAFDLVFERFLSDERQITPDIDIDFQADRREEVIQYVYERYGPEHTAMACTFVTYRSRSALRDVGKVLELPPALLERAARTLDFHEQGHQTLRERLQSALGEPLDTPLWKQFLDLCAQIRGFPRHLGIHNGGMVITGSLLVDRVPTEPATMPGRLVAQWDKEGLEDAGLVKIDLLGLRMLSALAEAVEHIQSSTGERPDLDTLSFDDPAIFAMISRADTMGVFQVESRAQGMLQPVFQPRCFADLIVAISLIRPGPIQGDMVHPYLRRRLGEEPVQYLHPALEPALRETLGVILFQEQVLKVARDLAGFSAGQGERLRRALGVKNAPEAIESFHDSFIQGAVQNGVSQAVAELVFTALRAFGGYSFPKSHAAAFAVLVYQSAWLKCYHPAAFYAALLNHQPMGFWSPAVLAGDARRHDLSVLPVDIQRSAGRCTVEEGHLRLGFNQVRGWGEATIDRLIDVRQEGEFSDLPDLCRRTRLPARVMENLILAGACDRWGIPRRKLLWELGKQRYDADELELTFAENGVVLPDLSPFEKLALEQHVLGLSPDTHLMELVRGWFTLHHVLSSDGLRRCAAGDVVRVGGLVVVHQAPPTAKGYHFLTLEDEWGVLDVVVRPAVYQRYRKVLHGTRLLVVEGVVQRQRGALNVLAIRAAGVDVTALVWD
jgi:error-prone DNA polymerase